MRILWVVIDALGFDKVTPEVMPTLCELGAAGMLGTGTGVLPATTYPNHATLVTGASPRVHGIYANEVLAGGEWVPASSVGPSVPTVFDSLTDAGLSSAAVFGDHELLGVCRARSATSHWPADGRAAEGIDLGPTGYAADSSTLAAAMERDLVSSDFAMVHLDENDGVSHVHGPQSEDAIRQAGLADEVLAELLGPYRRVWSDTLVLVVSDHCQEAVVRPVGAAPAERRVADAMAQLARRTVDAGGPALRWYVDGTCAVVAVAGDEPGRSEPAAIVALRRELEHIAWVEDVSEVAEGVFCVSGGPGELLGIDWGQLGDHGSTRCLEQVAVLGGGHAAVGELARRFSGRAVANATWAPVTLELLGG